MYGLLFCRLKDNVEPKCDGGVDAFKLRSV